MLRHLNPPPPTPVLLNEAEVKQIADQRAKFEGGYYLTDQELGLLHEVIMSFGTSHHSVDYYRRYQLALEQFRDRRMHPNEPCYCGTNCTCGG